MITNDLYYCNNTEKNIEILKGMGLYQNICETNLIAICGIKKEFGDLYLYNAPYRSDKDFSIKLDSRALTKISQA